MSDDCPTGRQLSRYVTNFSTSYKDTVEKIATALLDSYLFVYNILTVYRVVSTCISNSN